MVMEIQCKHKGQRMKCSARVVLFLCPLCLRWIFVTSLSISRRLRTICRWSRSSEKLKYGSSCVKLPVYDENHLSSRRRQFYVAQFAEVSMEMSKRNLNILSFHVTIKLIGIHMKNRHVLWDKACITFVQTKKWVFHFFLCFFSNELIHCFWNRGTQTSKVKLMCVIEVRLSSSFSLPLVIAVIFSFIVRRHWHKRYGNHHFVQEHQAFNFEPSRSRFICNLLPGVHY